MKLRLPKVSDVRNKTVLVRVDYNVPLKLIDGKYQVAGDRRLKASLETINFLKKNQAKIILMTHVGRPGGKPDQKFSSKPIADYMTQELQIPTLWVDDCIGESAKIIVDKMKSGEVLLLENTRFYAEEKKNDLRFAKKMAALADVYINDAFSNSHRNHASMVGVTKYLPSFAGFHLQIEVKTLLKLMTNPQRPFFAVVGGAKISDKIAVLEKLLKVADAVLVGGGVANNFLKAEDIEIYKSYLQDAPADLKKEGVDYVKLADKLIEETKNYKILKDGYVPLPKIIYPLDVVAAASPESTKTQIIDLTNGETDQIDNKDLMYLDIGPKTTRLYQELITQAKSVFWNGPMGYFEKEPFKKGTTGIAKSLAAATTNKTTTVIGGGDTIKTIADLGLAEKYTYVSTAGGAGLLFLAGQDLPALKPLTVTT
ncbi:MAG: phosphoglycerate kinase [Candidatus Pacebacteria bacterium]|jgi:phosphoglycerate kinase|nr:phosphoglycerate kinase [Candidatus Paceibacterota bacterium]MBT3511822.1 phosphoglycerate kinase [Candidatus Paceibacterota bacterium]MBT4004614.1 phosphoglycerate kinase [Candidatus Paceibacterota bacterium]MBT4358342.1 phosphoglycerate kinase [Candidatus Paceibacterota bacterium]MBT4681390.1 phosphoglycerate kinase [Candidatus Paceibacterota bacterium]